MFLTKCQNTKVEKAIKLLLENLVPGNAIYLNYTYTLYLKQKQISSSFRGNREKLFDNYSIKKDKSRAPIPIER